MKEKLDQIKKSFLEAIEKIENEEALRDLELKYLSRKGELSLFLRNLKNLDIKLRQELGSLANRIKRDLTKAYLAKKDYFLKKQEDILDPTLPGENYQLGHLHPITILRKEIEEFFSSLGFMTLDGPELESDYYNFEALNIPSHHPARDMQDTFYVKYENEVELDLLMRTQTSNTQVRAMLKYPAPLRAIVPGRCFRCESTDARHEHTFYQLEGFMIDKNINLANLKFVLEEFGKFLYGKDTKIRMRPKYFPFVEPGLNGEFSCFLCSGQGCRLCKNSGWLEVLGCGLIHPNVLKAGGIDPDKYRGFAFGFGLDRLVMLKYGIDDIRVFHNNDLKFLKQF
jgi:phenylalanyl-tRNA synthetase alpha chain